MYFAPSELEFKENVAGYKHLVPNGTKIPLEDSMQAWNGKLYFNA